MESAIYVLLGWFLVYYAYSYLLMVGIVLHGICYEGRGQDSNTTRGAVDPVL